MPIPISISTLRQIDRERQTAPYGERAFVTRRHADRLGVSVATLNAAIRRHLHPSRRLVVTPD